MRLILADSRQMKRVAGVQICPFEQFGDTRCFLTLSGFSSHRP